MKRSKPGEEMSVAELADLTWRVVKLKVAIIAIRWSRAAWALAERRQSPWAARASLFMFGIAERLHRGGRLKPLPRIFEWTIQVRYALIIRPGKFRRMSDRPARADASPSRD